MPDNAIYQYIKDYYGLTFRAGDRVRHSVTGRTGTVLEPKWNQHYLRVQHDRPNTERNWHPGEACILASEEHSNDE